MLRIVGKAGLVGVFVGCLAGAASGGEGAAGPFTVPAADKPRVVVMTDIGGDPDDEQSIVRFLLYACDVQVEGLLTGFGHGHYKRTRPDLLRLAVSAYGKVLPNLRKHRGDYPSEQELMGLIQDGDNGDPHAVGPTQSSQASEHVLRVLDRDDPRPVWFTIWGGPRELAQAIWKAQQTRTPEQLAALKNKIRVHSIADQDRTAGWVKQNHPDVFWIFSQGLFRGIWSGGDPETVSPAWLERNVRAGHGPLGGIYPAKASGKDGVKEGDTPSFLYVLPNGLSDPEHPEWGGWGGRFRPSGRGREYLPATDVESGRPNPLYSIQRWRRACQNEFEARMDWCVKAPAEANHAPVAACNGDRTRRVLVVAADANTTIKLTAAGSSDPDGDKLAYRWWVYREAGSYWADVPIRGAETAEASLTVPADATGRTIHVLLEVTDSGKPPLTAYRRAVIEVRGEPVQAPADAHVPPELRKGVTKLTGPPAESGPWSFFRGINVGGPPVTIDGNKWDGDDAPNFACTNRKLTNEAVPLLPPTDAERAKMIHSFRWDRSVKLSVGNVPAGRYAVYLYVWEETAPETFSVHLEGRRVARDIDSGQPGQWHRLGPWIVEIADGTIDLTTQGGAANISGIEIWRRRV